MGVEDAWEAARRAADDAGVIVGSLETAADLAAAERLLAMLWPMPSGDSPLATHLLRAFVHSGNYVAGVHAGDDLIGAAVAFTHPAVDGAAAGLHSHIAGVVPGAQHRHVGFALKLHQRAWALQRGIETVTWTYDPLVRRNAFFNLARLGATVDAYHARFYGDMPDGVNAGDDSDRCVVTWDLEAPRVEAAARRDLPSVDLAVLLDDGATVLLEDRDGEPVSTNLPPACTCAVAWVPEDFHAIRSEDAARGWRWREAARAALGGALGAGLRADGMTRDGWYVLRRRA